MSNNGWISIHRKLLLPDSKGNLPFKDPDALALWIHLLLRANHKQNTIKIKNQTITINRGQLLCGRKSLAESSGVQESKVERLLKRWESDQQIEQQKFNKFRIISIVNYDTYQNNEQQNDRSLNTNNKLINKHQQQPWSQELFIKPTIDDIRLYLISVGVDDNKATIESAQFYGWYEAIGWTIGKNRLPMANWRQAAQNWIGRMTNEKTKRDEHQPIDFESTGWSSEKI